jgi:uncharacterized protein (TIGR02300 family)
MSPTKKPAKKKPTPKKAPAKKAAPPKKVAKKETAPASTRRGPAPKSLQKRAVAAAEEKKMQKVKAATPAAGKRAARAPLADAVPARGGLGTKYTCFKCGSKFYDLNRPKALCPKCGADQREAPKQTAKQRQQAQAQAPPPKPPPLEPDLDRDREREVRRIGPLLDEDDEEIVIDDEPEDLELALEVVEGDDEFIEAEEEEPEEET